MNTATATTHTPAPKRPVFEDGFGKRYFAVGPSGEPLEVLALRDELTAVGSFEFALRERVTALGGFQNAAFARIRSVQRFGQDSATLAVVSDRVAGARLSDVLAVAEQQLLPLEIGAALYLIRQLVHAVAAMHDKLPGISHGAIAPERLIVTPDGHLFVAEHGLGAAFEQLHFSHEQYWQQLGIPLPNVTGVPRFDQRADILQIGAVALALIVGRPLYSEEYPEKIGALAERAWGLTASGGVEPLPAAVRTWLARALQLDARQSFASAVEAQAEFDRVVGSDYVAPLGSVRSFLSEYSKHAAASGVMSAPAGPATAVAAAPVPVSLPPPVAAVPVSTAPVATVPVATVPQVAPAPKPVAVAAPIPAPPARRQFLAEREPEVTMTNDSRWWQRRWVAAAVVLVVLASGGTIAGRRYLTPSAAAEASGTLVVNTNPAGAAVVVDDRPRGFAPLTLALPPGSHVLQILGDGAPRVIPITLTAGGTVSQFIDLPKAGPLTGQLQIRTEPSGARVTVDGSPRGTTPLSVDGLAPGGHTVVLTNDLGSVTHDVRIEAGASASLVVPMTPSHGANVSGWIAIATPVDVQVFENERLLGSSRSDRIMVAVGRHELDVVNEALGYRASRVVTVSPGQVANVRLDWPKGSMALNAQPWADVWIDGERIGETPIGNVAVPIGPHEVVFRHPDFGEQVVRTTVTLKDPARLSVDLRKK